jgi:AraC family transcriptional regulator
MSNRLEMVVGGRRQTALPTTPDFTSRTTLSDGFVMEGHRLSSLELPDHWVPFYGVGLQFMQGIGKRLFYQDGRHHSHTIRNGDSLVIAPQELRQYRLEAEAGCKFIVVSIEPVVLHSMVAGCSSRNPFELTRTWDGQDRSLREIVLKLQAEVTAGYPAGPLFAESLCTRLAEELIQRFSIGRPRLDQYKGGLSGAQLRRVLEYIDECLDLDLTGSRVAGITGLSKYHFGKAFRQSTGMSLHGYVLSRRMRRAQQLLAKPDLPLAAIAEAAGFSSQSHFTSVFSTRTGISPGSYRQMRRPISISLDGHDPRLSKAARF